MDLGVAGYVARVVTFVLTGALVGIYAERHTPGSGIGSDSWAAAQVALAELDSARSRAAVPLGDIDRIYTSAKVAAQDTAAIETARDRVIALVSEEDATLARLRAQVR